MWQDGWFDINWQDKMHSTRLRAVPQQQLLARHSSAGDSTRILREGLGEKGMGGGEEGRGNVSGEGGEGIGEREEKERCG